MLTLLGHVPTRFVLVEKWSFHDLHQNDMQHLADMVLMWRLVYLVVELCRHHHRHCQAQCQEQGSHSQLLDHIHLLPLVLYIYSFDFLVAQTHHHHRRNKGDNSSPRRDFPLVWDQGHSYLVCIH